MWVWVCVCGSVSESMRPILAGYFTQHVNDADGGSGVERTFLSGILSPTRSASTQSLQNGVCISKYRCFLSTAISSVRSKPSSFSDEQNSSCAYKQTTLIHAVAVSSSSSSSSVLCPLTKMTITMLKVLGSVKNFSE